MFRAKLPGDEAPSLETSKFSLYCLDSCISILDLTWHSQFPIVVEVFSIYKKHIQNT